MKRIRTVNQMPVPNRRNRRILFQKKSLILLTNGASCCMIDNLLSIIQTKSGTKAKPECKCSIPALKIQTKQAQPADRGTPDRQTDLMIVSYTLSFCLRD